MMRKRILLAAVTLVSVTAISMAPADAQAGGAEELRECLQSIEGASGEEQARSMCLWEHYDYMASYGR